MIFPIIVLIYTFVLIDEKYWLGLELSTKEVAGTNNSVASQVTKAVQYMDFAL